SLRGYESECWALMVGSSTPEMDSQFSTVFVEYTSGNPVVIFAALRRFLKRGKELKPDVMIGFHPLSNIFIALAKLFFPKIIVIATQRNPSENQNGFLAKIEKFLGSTRLYDANISVSQHVRESYNHYPKSYTEKLCV